MEVAHPQSSDVGSNPTLVRRGFIASQAKLFGRLGDVEECRRDGGRLAEVLVAEGTTRPPGMPRSILEHTLVLVHQWEELDVYVPQGSGGTVSSI